MQWKVTNRPQTTDDRPPKLKHSFMAFKFEKLEVWKMTINIADDIDKLTQTFPKHELYI